MQAFNFIKALATGKEMHAGDHEKLRLQYRSGNASDRDATAAYAFPHTPAARLSDLGSPLLAAGLACP